MQGLRRSTLSGCVLATATAVMSGLFVGCSEESGATPSLDAGPTNPDSRIEAPPDDIDAPEQRHEVAPAPAEVTVALTVQRRPDGTLETMSLPGWPTSLVTVPAPSPGAYALTVVDARDNVGTVRVTVPD